MSNQDIRKNFILQKLLGHEVTIGRLGDGYTPRSTDNPVLYVPLPEYGIYLVKQNEPSTTGTGK